MKTLIIILIFFNTALDHHCTAQNLTPNSKLENLQVNPKYREKHNLKMSKSKQEVHQIYTVNDCSCSTAAEYSNLFDNKASNFVKSAAGPTYEGTKNGIKMRGYSTRVNISTENSRIPENNITTLALDDRDNLWIGTYSSGIVVGTGNPIKPFRTHTITTQELHIYSISIDGAGCVWVTYKSGGMECFKNEISVFYSSNE